MTAFQLFHWRFIENIAIRIALRSLLSPEKQEKAEELTKQFDRFKQQFDRGISVQSAGTLGMLLELIGTILYLPFKANC